MKKKEERENKKCMDCGIRKRYQNYRRCYRCILRIRKEKKEERIKKAKLRKQGTEKYKKAQKKKLHRECWTLMSEIVRRKGKDWRGYQLCYTCRKSFHWKEMHAGHRHHNKLDFDIRNIKSQCAQCNTFLHGNLGEYERNIIEDHGLEYAKKLKQDADRFIGYSYEELESIKKDLEVAREALQDQDEIRSGLAYL